MQHSNHSRAVRSESRYVNYSALLVFLFLILARTTIFAESATWNLSPTTGDWNTAANWTPATVPDGATDIATFGASNMVNVSLSADVEVSAITFNAGAGVYTIATGDTSTLTLSGAGIINDSGVFQNFAAEAGPSSYGLIIFSQNASAGSQTKFTSEGSPYSPAVILFEDNATAGSGQFTNIGSAIAFQGGGYLQFGGNSSAENAVLTNQGGTIENATGGQIGFSENATAANATITNNAGPKNTFGNTSGGTLAFTDGATAGNATITNKGSTIDGGTGGVTFFAGDAGHATLIAEGGANGGAGGQIVFMSPGTGGSSRIEVFGNGTFDFRSESELTIGSLEGDGLALLGPTLTVGSNNLSTVFSGVMQSFGSLTKIGTGTLTLSGANTYSGATDVNGGTLTVDGSITSDVTVNTGGTLAGGGTVNNVTVNTGGTVAPGGAKILTVNGDYQQNGNSTLAPLISGTDSTEYDQLIVSGSVTVSSGAILDLNFSNQFAPHTGDTFNLLTFGSISGSFSTVNIVGLADGFQYTISDDGNGHLQLKALNDGVATSTAKKLLNISTRLDILTGDKVLIGGFIITGPSPKEVILRAIGPSLELSGLTGVLADPVLELHAPDGTVIINNNWKDTQEQEIIDTGLEPSDDLESAIVATLDPGAYTAIVRGVDNGTGVGLVEAYDIDQAEDSELANVSTRGFVQTGDNVMIGGFILGGDAIESSVVIVRAIGPSLGPFGVTDPLQDPILELHDQDGTLIASNDNWKDSQELEIEAIGLAPTDDRESVIAATLMPNAYTAIVLGNNNTTGVGLVEVYRLQP
jgi:autotransporter-associated beta strand protein